MSVEERFELIYTKLKNNYEQELLNKKLKSEKERKHNIAIICNALLVNVILTLIISILCIIYKANFFESSSVSGIIFIILILIAIIMHKKLKVSSTLEYRASFKSIVIDNLIKTFNENYTYSPLSGIQENEYTQATFEKSDIYVSKDLYQYQLGKSAIKIAYVSTENIHTNNDGEKVHQKVFDGMFAIIKLPKNVDFQMYITKDIKEKNFLEQLMLKKFPMEKLNVKMDSMDFEDLFDVYSSDEMIAMQLLTADTMQFLIDLRNKMNYNFEITIKEDCIYIRFDSQDIFDMDIYTLDKNILFEKYKHMSYVFETTNKIKEIVETTVFI